MKKLLSICSLILITVMLCSCSGNNFSISYIAEEATDKGKTAIEPIENLKQAGTVTVPLYFRFYDEPYLSTETRTLTLAQYQSLEYVILTALLQGPSPEMQELKTCIDRDTQLVSVSQNEDYLYVTLSKEFLTLPSGTKSDWQNDSAVAETVYQYRRMAVYSIVNTICDLGTYSKVQIYIDTLDNGTGERMLRKDMGFVGDGKEDQPLEPLSRNTDYLLTPVAAVRTALQSYSMKKWSTVYNYLGDAPSATVQKPILEEYQYAAAYDNLTLTEYTVGSDYTVSSDGSRAVVQISYKLKTKNASYVVTDVPLIVIRERECWKISYEAFTKYMRVQE